MAAFVYRHRQPHTVALSRKWCKIETLLPQTVIRWWYMAYRIAHFPITLNNLKVIYLRQAFLNVFFPSLCSSWQDFIRHSVSRGSSAITELAICQLQGGTKTAIDNRELRRCRYILLVNSRCWQVFQQWLCNKFITKDLTTCFLTHTGLYIACFDATLYIIKDVTVT